MYNVYSMWMHRAASGFTFMRSRYCINGKVLNFNLLTTGIWDLYSTVRMWFIRSLLIICWQISGSSFVTKRFKNDCFMETGNQVNGAFS